MNIQSVSNIPNIAVSAASANKMGDVGVAMVSKSLETAQENGDALKKMMERSVNPQIGGNFDISA